MLKQIMAIFSNNTEVGLKTIVPNQLIETQKQETSGIYITMLFLAGLMFLLFVLLPNLVLIFTHFIDLKIETPKKLKVYENQRQEEK